MSEDARTVLEAAGCVAALVLAWYVGWRCGREDERESWAYEIACLRRENEHFRKQAGL